MRIHRSERGFSFIEMLVAMVLVGIIASLSIPRLRGSLEKQNVRSAKALMTTLVATARGVAVQRGCPATLNMTTDSIWVTACGVNPPAASVVVGTKKLVGSEFGVTVSPSNASIVYDPRGIQTQFVATTVRFIGPNYRDSVMINQVGKVMRQ